MTATATHPLPTGPTIATVMLVLLALLVLALHMSYALVVSQTEEAMATHPRDEYRPSPFPPGRRYPFAFTFQRIENCPDRIEWRWGGGERKTVQVMPAEVRDDCSGFTARVEHVFEHETPRRVYAVAYLEADEIARTCVNWPSGTPCAAEGDR